MSRAKKVFGTDGPAYQPVNVKSETNLRVVAPNSEANDTGFVSLGLWYLKKCGSYTEALAALEAANECGKTMRRVRARIKKQSEGQPLLEELENASN